MVNEFLMNIISVLVFTSFAILIYIGIYAVALRNACFSKARATPPRKPSSKAGNARFDQSDGNNHKQMSAVLGREAGPDL